MKKITPSKKVFERGITTFLVCLFFLSPISMSFSHKTTGLSDGVRSSLMITYNVSKVEAQLSNDNGFGPTTDPIQGGLDGTTNNVDYTSVNSPSYVPSTDPPISNGPNGSQGASTQSSAQNSATDPNTVVGQAGATGKGTTNDKRQEHNFIVQLLGNLILGIGAMCLLVGGEILDLSIRYLVFEMGDMINANSFGGAINNLWTLIRDICNLAFIFGFIYLGIRTIFDPESASVKRTLARIIIGALLINFSLFIVKFVVDFSNFTAFKIYQAMTSGSGSISGAILEEMGVTSFYSSKVSPQDFARTTGGGAFWFYVIGALMLMVAAVTFFIAAVMFIVRFVVLIFLMLGSPILFAAPVFPKFEQTASMLWGKLFSNAFFAPVYLLLLLMCIKVVHGLMASMSTPKQMISDTLMHAPTVDSYAVILNYVVIIFFLIQSLLIAQKMGAVGGDTAVSAFHGMRKSAQGYMGRGIMRATGAGEYLEKLQKNSTNATVARVAGSLVGAKFGSGRSYADTHKEDKEMEARKNRQKQVSNISTAVANSTEAEKEYNKVHAAGSGATQAQKNAARTAHHAAKIELEQKLSNASTEQTLELLKKHKGDSNGRKAILANLSASQFDGLMKVEADKLDDQQKANMRQERSAAIEERLIATENQKRHDTANAGGSAFVAATFTDAIQKASGKDLDSLEFSKVVANAGLLSNKQIDDMSLSTTAKSLVINARNTALTTEFAGGAGATAIFKRIASETERAKLPGNILKDPASAMYLSQGVLTKMLDNDGIFDSDRAKIRGNVETVWLANPNKRDAFKKFFDTTPAGQQYI